MITHVWEVTVEEGGLGWQVGHQDVDRIELKADGNGLSGYYDRIHIFLKGGDKVILPAWSCSWREADDGNQES
jgi:hypothetical protein